MPLPLRVLTSDAFAPYGAVLDLEDPNPDRAAAGQTEFRVITRSSDPTGWRLAVLRIRNHEVDRLEAHPTTQESFEPMWGVTVICVAQPQSPERFEAFVLDRPVCLNVGVWHAVMALTAESQIKIAENLEVTGQHHPLATPLRAVLAETV
jgi:ureidoglycolate hydrolase